MTQVKFYSENEVIESKMKFVVMMARYNDKWIMVRHRDRDTWEIPGGHIEEFEKAFGAAKRELYEETGAKDFDLHPVCTYSVIKDQGEESFGKLYYAKVYKLEELPNSEIVEIKFVDDISEDLTYPFIQPMLWEKVSNHLEKHNI